MKSNEYWALYNYSALWSLDKTKKACRLEAENNMNKPWSECKKGFRIVKVRIEEIK